MSILESEFQSKVKERLSDVPGLWFFVKEAASLRGLPDLIGVYRGRFFAWELKRNSREANKKVGRIVLQKYFLMKIRKAGGIGRIVHPGNLEECLQEILRSSQ